MTPAQLATIQARAYQNMSPWTEAAFAQLLAQDNVGLWVADHAFLLARIVLDEAEVLSIATDPAHQRRGQATEVLRRYETAAHQSNVRTSFLEVSDQNLPARAFYEAKGYFRVGLRKKYYRQPDGSFHDALLLSRALT